MGAETSTVAPDVAVLPLTGRLDDEAGLRLLAAAQRALAGGATRLHIDLCEVTGFTPPGAAALVACRHLSRRAGTGGGPRPVVEVHYRTSRGPGREALLTAFADVRDHDGAGTDDGAGDEPVAIDLRVP
jgi:hypothetical protein